ncbi:RNA ligase family protein [Paenibacillus chitinolyticus]|uniref:RNA ligase family protein n=1 Tax=Paenibacillus chitinolyticus TaxID=79263 RepID=UPI00366EF78F
MKYNSEHTKTFNLFDIYNELTQEYVDYYTVKSEAESIGLTDVPVFYEGKYRSFEHIETIVGKSKLGGKLGDLNTEEVIVVKNTK